MPFGLRIASSTSISYVRMHDIKLHLCELHTAANVQGCAWRSYASQVKVFAEIQKSIGPNINAKKNQKHPRFPISFSDSRW